MAETPFHVNISAPAGSVADLRAIWTEQHNQLAKGVNRQVRWMWVLPVLSWVAFSARGSVPLPWLPFDGALVALVLFTLWVGWMFLVVCQFVEAQQANYTLHQLDIEEALLRIEGGPKGH